MNTTEARAILLSHEHHSNEERELAALVLDGYVASFPTFTAKPAEEVKALTLADEGALNYVLVAPPYNGGTYLFFTWEEDGVEMAYEVEWAKKLLFTDELSRRPGVPYVMGIYVEAPEHRVHNPAQLFFEAERIGTSPPERRAELLSRLGE